MRLSHEVKKTEAGWQEALDRFWIQATEVWFKWVTWVMLVGALKYIEQKTGSPVVGFLYRISLVAIYMYWQAFFFSIEFILFPSLKKGSTKRTASLLISGVLVLVVYFSLTQLIPLAKI